MAHLSLGLSACGDGLVGDDFVLDDRGLHDPLPLDDGLFDDVLLVYDRPVDDLFVDEHGVLRVVLVAYLLLGAKTFGDGLVGDDFVLDDRGLHDSLPLDDGLFDDVLVDDHGPLDGFDVDDLCLFDDVLAVDSWLLDLLVGALLVATLLIGILLVGVGFDDVALDDVAFDDVLTAGVHAGVHARVDDGVGDDGLLEHWGAEHLLLVLVAINLIVSLLVRHCSALVVLAHDAGVGLEGVLGVGDVVLVTVAGHLVLKVMHGVGDALANSGLLAFFVRHLV